ncbi:hypothetical protein BS50DRAFT_3055 [Corynespora cassiicola Philippines]|uniref:Uncharacterized protein n=1 Tax=Corynespora cassiicola Philippines TaxID=1448308 RepID=A0A2T2P8A7_CORCC|nr:hypothetical protein BS50DRAFT_3055 [Corynespora cassiicola Philippines]
MGVGEGRGGEGGPGLSGSGSGNLGSHRARARARTIRAVARGPGIKRTSRKGREGDGEKGREKKGEKKRGRGRDVGTTRQSFGRAFVREVARTCHQTKRDGFERKRKEKKRVKT